MGIVGSNPTVSATKYNFIPKIQILTVLILFPTHKFTHNQMSASRAASEDKHASA